MKRLFLLLVLMGGAFTAQAQTQYHIFYGQPVSQWGNQVYCGLINSACITVFTSTNSTQYPVSDNEVVVIQHADKGEDAYFIADNKYQVNDEATEINGEKVQISITFQNLRPLE